VARVVVVSPADTGIRQARAKTDRLDARTLAKLLASGELDAVWMPDRETWVMPRRLRLRGQLVWARSGAKNQIHAVLMRCLVGRAPFADLFGVKGRCWLAELGLPEEERETVDSAVRQIELLDSEIADVERLIASAAPESPQIGRLMTVPGVNVIVAASFLAAIGDIRRFESPARAGRLPRPRSARSQRPGGPRADLEAGLAQGPARPGRGELEHRPPAGADAGLLSADPRPPRPPGRGRRRGAQARLPVLVPAHRASGCRSSE